MEARLRWVVAIALAAVCLLVFSPALRCGFLNYDDNAYVTDNPHVKDGLTAAGVRWALTEIQHFYWQPVTWISHMLDVTLYGLNPAGHHLTSLLLHAVNVMLLFVVLLRLFGGLGRCLLTAALFGLHPQRVESVAWIAERKDVLSAFWFLGAIWCYLNYVDRPTRARYYLVMLAFVLGLATKPMVMTLPVVLLLLDWWPLKRKAVAEKAPMLALSCLSAFVTSIATGRLGLINWGSTLTLGQRAGNALVSAIRYLELTFWPHDLAVLYPFRTSVPLWESAAALLVLAGITGLAVWQRRRRPYLLAGWIWFGVVLFPATGLVSQVGFQGMADRFTYLPQIGLTIAVVWGVSAWAGKRGQSAAATLAVLFLAIFAARASAYVSQWRDSVTIFQHTVAVTRDNPAAQHFLAAALDDAGRYTEALPHHAESVRLEPRYFVAQASYGAALARQGDLAAAIEHERAALRIYPNYPDAQRLLDEYQKRLDLSKASGLKLGSER